MQANKQKRRWEKEDTLPRKRARQSCEACKARKTKCVGVENGDCEYCKSLNVPCEFNLKNRKRPFYRVSEETYDCLVKLLRRFVSEEELPELTVQTISGYLEQMGSDPPSHISPDRRARDAEPSNAVSAPNTQDDPQDHDPQELAVPNDNSLFQEELGCMTLDSMGKYRYVGANSSLRWYHAARMVSERPILPDPSVVIPLKTGLLPPTTPENVANQHRVEHYLPCHRLSMEYTTRFFAQAHSMHCFYSVEQFYTMLDHTLENRGKTSSASWLCSLYSIFAIGSIRPNAIATPDKALPEDIQSPAGYLALAKELVPRVAEDADIESVRAFALLSLAMHSNCYSLEAYLYLGTAARIGFSLGLHRDIFPKTLSTVERERHRRVWWTVYVLDHEMANRYGYPCAISDDLGFMTTGPASEQILDPSPNMPQGFQALSVSLVQLQKKINMECFFQPVNGGRLPINLVTQSLVTLKKWLDKVPHHLRWDCTAPPQHSRSIAVLHLRNACIEAAEMSVRILHREAMCILLLALRKAQSAKHQDMLRTCLGTLASMEKVGWCERIVLDIQARVYESGLLDLEAPTGIQDQGLLSDGPGSSEYAEFDFDVSQWDLFQPQGLDSFAQLMNTFPDATFAAGMEQLF
ncbi:Transcription factor [Penicillium griseofulvum]|uniref:Transcription factor n=1 Tax=Penicillium patulum TaxID=5078 RepID=A0A135LTD6_PENPA|nr:Transcription factor [Penicillium griseofulvum]KXG52244.1 Transcription factor [Penicillium griseofulvum]